MKNILITLLIGIFILALSATVHAQDKGHVYTITTWKIQIPEDGSRAELNEMLKEFFQKVDMKNDKIISTRTFRHLSGSDMRDLVFITEYANWADIMDSQNMQDKLMEQAWPDEKERTAFMKKFFKYAVTHSDEILREIPDLRK